MEADGEEDIRKEIVIKLQQVANTAIPLSLKESPALRRVFVRLWCGDGSSLSTQKPAVLEEIKACLSENWFHF